MNSELELMLVLTELKDNRLHGACFVERMLVLTPGRADCQQGVRNPRYDPKVAGKVD